MLFPCLIFVWQHAGGGLFGNSIPYFDGACRRRSARSCAAPSRSSRSPSGGTCALTSVTRSTARCTTSRTPCTRARAIRVRNSERARGYTRTRVCSVRGAGAATPARTLTIHARPGGGGGGGGGGGDGGMHNRIGGVLARIDSEGDVRIESRSLVSAMVGAQVCARGARYTYAFPAFAARWTRGSRCAPHDRGHSYARFLPGHPVGHMQPAIRHVTECADVARGVPVVRRHPRGGHRCAAGVEATPGRGRVARLCVCAHYITNLTLSCARRCCVNN